MGEGEEKLKSAYGKNEFCDHIVFFENHVWGIFLCPELPVLSKKPPQMPKNCPKLCPELHLGHFFEIRGGISGEMCKWLFEAENII